MKSLAQLVNRFTTEAQNNDATMQALGIQYMSDSQRYLLQRYFDNERTITTSTIGGASYTLTSGPVAGATTATLSSSWALPTSSQLTNFSDGEQRNVLFTNGSAAISWEVALTATVTTAITTTGVQYYPIPANVSKITDNTISVGQLKFTVIPIESRQDWDKVNFLPYSSDLPQYAFIYNGTLGIFPIPSTTGNILSFNYKSRIPDFSSFFLFSATDGTPFVAGSTAYDYQVGTISGTLGSTTVTGVSSKWTTAQGAGKGLGMTAGVDVTKFNLYLIASPAGGEGLAYPIQQFNSDTSLVLALPLVNAIASSASYTIGQMPTLFEDFQDTLIYYALKIYFNSIVKDPQRYKMYEDILSQKLTAMEEYLGSKQINVDLGGNPNITNPNLYIFSNQ